MHMKTNIEVNTIDNYAGEKYSPSTQQLSKWSELCVCRGYNHIIINIMLVGLLESQKFNINFRTKDGPTNVLSFPYENNKNLIGDLIICSPLVITEATTLAKTEASHWRHLFVHGMLHLQGYDHQNDTEEQEMTNLEDKVIAAIIKIDKGSKA
jgi:probable rRNA maturation factor